MGGEFEIGTTVQLYCVLYLAIVSITVNFLIIIFFGSQVQKYSAWYVQYTDRARFEN